MTPLDPSALSGLWRQPPSSPLLVDWIESLSSPAPTPKAEVKSYPDEEYHNFYALGISLTFTCPPSGASEKGLDRIDIYNPPSATAAVRSRRPKGPIYGPPQLPVTFNFASDSLTVPSQKAGEPSRQIPRPSHLAVNTSTTGKAFVGCFGEPSKKSEGKIIGDLGLGLWMEWDHVELRASGERVGKETCVVGVMVELRDSGSSGNPMTEQEKRGGGGVWDRAASWEWGCLKIFDPSSAQIP